MNEQLRKADVAGVTNASRTVMTVDQLSFTVELTSMQKVIKDRYGQSGGTT